MERINYRDKKAAFLSRLSGDDTNHIRELKYFYTVAVI